MAGAKVEVSHLRSSYPLLENIKAQNRALRAVAQHQLGPGRDALMRCAELLRSSSRIVLSGMGASHFACTPLSYLLGEHGVSTAEIESSELLYYRQNALQPDTAVILVSRSGESVEITKLLPLLRDRGCRVIGVANVPGSTLASAADEAVIVNSPPDELVAVQTYTGTLITLLLLGAAYLHQFDRVAEELAATLDGVDSYLEGLLRNGMYRDFIAGGSVLYLLGRGASLGSLHEGALLMHEVAKMPAIAMSSAQFRHGPVEVVSKAFHCVVFGSQQKTVQLDLNLAKDLQSVGAQVRWVGPEGIGPEVSGSPVTSFAPWPKDVPERFASVLEIMPMQMLAYEAALAHNITPGEFRFAGPVTLSESGFSNVAR